LPLEQGTLKGPVDRKALISKPVTAALVHQAEHWIPKKS
jgi:hypothetical protein